MNRLSVRVFASHMAVALVGVMTTFVVVRLLAPRLFDSETLGGGQGRGAQQAPRLRQAFATAVDQALWVGLAISAVAAAALTGLLLWRVLRPLERVRRATGELAAGNYGVRLELPRVTELSSVASDVNALAERLETTETQRSELVSEVAHEMRTPLTVIDGYVEAMIDGVMEPTPARLGEISTEVAKLRRLADDFSLLSRSEVVRHRLDLRPTDVGAVVTAAAEGLRSQFEAAGVGLVTRVDAPALAPVDAGRVGQIVTNLVGNALRACAPGGQVDVRVDAAGSTVTIEVRDDGRGLAADDLERVFQRFYRVGDAKHPGTGIGLPIARALAEAHGGSVVAASAGPGRGATFTVTLPTEPRA